MAQLFGWRVVVVRWMDDGVPRRWTGSATAVHASQYTSTVAVIYHISMVVGA